MHEFLVPKLATRGAVRDDADLVLATFAYTERCAATGELQLVVEHLDRAGLRALHHALYASLLVAMANERCWVGSHHVADPGAVALQNRDKPVVSVLQRFVPTKSGYNHTLQGVFTHENCVIRKCVNANLVADSALGVTQRTITFEADELALRTRA